MRPGRSRRRATPVTFVARPHRRGFFTVWCARRPAPARERRHRVRGKSGPSSPADARHYRCQNHAFSGLKIDDAASNSGLDPPSTQTYAAAARPGASPRVRRDLPRGRDARSGSQTEQSPPILERNVVHQIVRPVRHFQLQPVQVGREDQLAPQPRILARLVRQIQHI